jgi:hypothetical protein
MNELLLNFTSPEQSKRLLELGVPDWSADCVYDCALIGGEKYYSLSILEDELFSVYKRIWEDPCTDIIPCWSVGRLIEIFLLCTPYKDIAMNKSNLVEQMVVSLFMVNKDGLLDFSKLED